MDITRNNTLVTAAVLALGGVLALIGGGFTGNTTANLIGLIALLIGVAIGIGEGVGIARNRRTDQSS